MTLFRAPGRTLDTRLAAHRTGEDELRRARTAAGVFALNLFQLRGLAIPGNSQLGQIIEQAVERMSATDRAAGTLSASAIDTIASAVTQAAPDQRPINITSAEAARLTQATGWHPYGAAGERMLTAVLAALAAADREGRGLSSSGGGLAYNGALPGTYNPQMLEAQNEAARLGMFWATQNTDLLRLGRDAIRTLHDAGVKEKSFNRLTKDGGFSEKGAVTLAKRLHEMGRTPDQINEHFEVTTRASEAMTGQNRADQAEFEHRHLDLYKAETPQERANAGKRMDEFIAAHPADPSREKDVQRYRDMVREETGIELKAKAAATADQTQAKADQTQAKADQSQTKVDQTQANIEKTATKTKEATAVAKEAAAAGAETKKTNAKNSALAALS